MAAIERRAALELRNTAAKTLLATCLFFHKKFKNTAFLFPLNHTR